MNRSRVIGPARPDAQECRRRVPPLLLTVSLTLMAACTAGDLVSTATPEVAILSVVENLHNTLSAVVTLQATNADSARLLIRSEHGEVDSTPHHLLNAAPLTITALGLRPRTTYALTAEVAADGGMVASEVIDVSTGDLPPELQSVRLAVSGTGQPGFRLLPLFQGGVGFALAFDDAGEIRWYRRFDDGTSEIKQQPSGNITAFHGRTSGWQPTPGRFVEVTPGGEVVGTYQAPEGFYTDNHELLLTPVNPAGVRAHLFTYDLRPTDLSPIGGAKDAQVAGHQLIRLSPDGEVEFSWNAWDYFVIEDWVEPPEFLKQYGNIDFDHPNSLDFDRDGHYIVSFRHLGEITKIDSRTGDIIWRFGGRNNEFVIHNDPLDGFSGQHSVRVLENGNLLVYDNGERHVPSESRAVEYSLDPDSRTATMVWEFRHDPPIFTQFGGSVQRRSNGNTVIGFGWVGVVTEVGPDGSVLWEGRLQVEGVDRVFYRAIAVPSLYRYQEP